MPTAWKDTAELPILLQIKSRMDPLAADSLQNNPNQQNSQDFRQGQKEFWDF